MVGDGYADELSAKVELEKGIHFLGRNAANKPKMMGCFGEKSDSLSKRILNLGSQELTLSYLCENSKLGVPEKDVSGQNLLSSPDKFNGSGRFKGKGIDVFEEEDRTAWFERDFLQLSGCRAQSSKRDSDNVEAEGENKVKKSKVESLNLSLALPDVSVSLARSYRFQTANLPSQLKPTRSVQSLGPSYNNTRTTYSNDFTAASLSQSCSRQISHNLSCSMTRNSTENYDYSGGSHRKDCDRIWNCGEGTNGSVHSRFRPIGDGAVALSNHGDGGGLYKMASSENVSFLPSELPARQRMETLSGGDSRWNLESIRDSEDMDGRRISRPERILRVIVSESVPEVTAMMRELSSETLGSVRDFLKNMIESAQRRDELVNLQKRLDRRSDLTNEALSKSQKSHIEILVSIKLGLSSFLDSKNQLPATELVEIFSLERCRNIICRRLLPVDDCDCKICSSMKGFCSECMCPVCLNFDCASHTCSWVGCDTCSHWCHAACALQKNLIKPGPCLTGPSGASEMQYHCVGCRHVSEMFGFVKDVFISGAKNWGVDSLIKELGYVKIIFQGSEDRRGKELHSMADEMLSKLQNKMITPPRVCHAFIQLFSNADTFLGMASSSLVSRDLADRRQVTVKDIPAWPPSTSLVPKSSAFFSASAASNGRQEPVPIDPGHSGGKTSLIIEDEWSVKPVKKDGFNSLDSLVRIKEAEARMFQSRADEAKRELESYKRMMRLENEKLDEEYTEKLANLCLQETEERLKKKMEEVKVLENSHRDYYKMKIRMQSEISTLLKRMEAMKQQLV